MQRRGVLALGALALAGCVTSARDESGPRNPPTTPEGGEPQDGTEERQLRIVGSEITEGEEGSLVLSIVVENTAAERRSGTLVATATVADTEYEASEEVSLAGETQATFDLVFDVSYDSWEESGGLTFGWASQFED
ncbi:MAG: hypothetical protein ABEH90_10310 [Halolamina sp.]